MSFELGRASGPAVVAIDPATCTGCGLCVKVCKGGPLSAGEKGAPPRINADPTRIFDCVACGQCMAVCPNGAITVSGRDLTPADVLPLAEGAAGYDDLHALMLARRSVRLFQKREVEASVVEQILASASTAPMGLPPSEVGVLVLHGRDKVKAFRNDLFATVKKIRFLFSPVALGLMRPFIGRENYVSFKQFVAPIVDAYIEQDKAGEDWFFYDAPLAFCFYGSAFADPADPVIAATYAMLAAESLGLGTCMLGFPGYILQYHGALRARWNLPRKIVPGIVLVAGYPGVRYTHSLRRRFTSVRYA